SPREPHASASRNLPGLPEHRGASLPLPVASAPSAAGEGVRSLQVALNSLVLRGGSFSFFGVFRPPVHSLWIERQPAGESGAASSRTLVREYTSRVPSARGSLPARRQEWHTPRWP